MDIELQPQTADGARAIAIDWQSWASEQNLSIAELIEWQAYFIALGTKFDLNEEFTEEGII